MKKVFCGSLGAVILAAGSVLAQEDAPATPANEGPALNMRPVEEEKSIARLGFEPNPAPETKTAPSLGFRELDNAPIAEPIVQANTTASPCTRVWGEAEYLFWHFNSAPINVPLVSGNTDPRAIGALNEPGTTTLFGNGSGQSNNFGWFSGGRVTLGAWLGGQELFGVEGSGFLLEDRGILFQASSPGGAAPIVSIPFTATQPFNLNPAGPTSLNAGNAANTVSVALNSRLWGAESNAVVNLYTTNAVRVIGLVGFRYLDLHETLGLNDTFFDPATAGAVVVTDSFGTRNQFYSGQIGGRAEVNVGRFNVSTTLKVALGTNHETLDIGGNTAVNNGAFGFATGTTPGGVFAETSNSGHFTRNVFAVAPEAQLKVGFAVTPRIQTFVGYNFLYLNNVLRPGNQLNSNINPTQNAFFVPPGTVVGAAVPVANLQSSTFWAQGVSVGVKVIY